MAVTATPQRNQRESHRGARRPSALWPQELLSALSSRRSLPRLRRGENGWVIQPAGEPDAPVDLADHDPERRALLARADGLDGVVIAPSALIGIEALPPAEAALLIRAYHDGVSALPHPFLGWATTLGGV